LVALADLVVGHPADSLPQKLNDPAALKAMYRLMNQSAVTHEAVLMPHRERTKGLMSEPGRVVLILHDDTELDYTGLLSLQDTLGQIGNGTHRGFICHNSLAVSADSGEVIGLANQILHQRARAPKNEPRHALRQRSTRESRLWSQASAAIGVTPAGCRWIDVCDRGADIFEFIENEIKLEREFVVRAYHNRRIFTAENEEAFLHDHLRSLPSRETRTVEVSAKSGRPARTATMHVAAARVSLRPPPLARGEHGREPIPVVAIRTWEPAAPQGVEPLEWFLLAPARTDVDAASVCIGHYEKRWIIEEYHKAKKTGCAIENLQFTTVEGLKPTIALLSVVAVHLLTLRDWASRSNRCDEPATKLIEPDYVELLSLKRWKTVKRDLTVREFLLALGRLGGHQNRKHDGLPGWLTLWRGWMQLHAMVEGARAIRLKRSG